MATIKNTPELAEFFAQADPYRWDVDNRPLTHLLNNDIAINAELEPLTAEVHAARDSSIYGAYQTLDERLEAMENQIGNSVSVDDVNDIQEHQYGDFISNSEALRRACPSGFFDHNGLADLAVGDGFDDFGAIKTTLSLGTDYPNTVVLNTLHGATYKPIRALVNGWVVRMFSEKTGALAVPPVKQVTIDLGAAPASGKLTNFVFLEVWLERVSKTNVVLYKNGAVDSVVVPPDETTTDDHLHPDVIHTVKAMAGEPLVGSVGQAYGDWIQLRHRFRVISDVNPNTNPTGFDDVSVQPQGGANAPVNGYTFVNQFAYSADAGLWKAGAGDTQSKQDLNTYDGFVYAIPVMMVHRRNTGSYTVGAQNGSKYVNDLGVQTAASGYMTSGLSGRPDGLYYDAIDQRDILDMRHRVSLTGFNLRAELLRSWQMLTRGEMRTSIKELQYDINDDGNWEGQSVWGHTLTQVDRIANNVDVLNPANYLRDRGVVVVGQSEPPLSEPDRMRLMWSRNPTTQPVRFNFTQGNATVQVAGAPTALISYDPGTDTLLFNTAGMSGAGTGGTIVDARPPLIVKKSDIFSKPTLVTSGLGSASASCKMTGLAGAAAYVGLVYIVYPGGSGVTFPHKRILSSDVWDGGATRVRSLQFGETGKSSPSAGNEYDAHLTNPGGLGKLSGGDIILADTWNYRVIRLNPTTLAKTHQFGVSGTPYTNLLGSANTNCTPLGVAVDSGDNVYVCDTLAHRIVKLSSTLTYVAAAGSTAPLAGSSNTAYWKPAWITVGTVPVGGIQTECIFFTDQMNNRVVQLRCSNLAYVASYGAASFAAGSGKFGLKGPRGITFVPSSASTGTFTNGALWVADHGNQRIAVLKVLDSSFSYIFQITSKAQEQAIFDTSIADVAVDTLGNFYIQLEGRGFINPNDPQYRHVVKRFNANMSYTGQIGQDGVTGSPETIAAIEATNPTYVTLLNRPHGMAIDPTGTYLFLCDSDNHRVLRIALNAGGQMTLAGQFGRTGQGWHGGSTLAADICASPVDVAADSNGFIYIASLWSRVMKVDTATWTVTASFGLHHEFSSTITSDSRLGFARGIACNHAGTKIVVVDQYAADEVTGDIRSRVVRLDANMAYATHWIPTYDNTVLNRRMHYMVDVEYSFYDEVSEGGDGYVWYVAMCELPLGKNPPVGQYFSIMRFNDSPSSTPNWAPTVGGSTPGRFVAYSYPTGFAITATKIYTATEQLGLATYDKIDPTQYEFSNSPSLNILFPITSPDGMSYSDGKVLVAEPTLHCIQCFDSVAGFYMGSAGVPYTSGDDAARLNSPKCAMLSGETLWVADNQNHRLLRRHQSAPWVGADGTITCMIAPNETDKLDLFYDTESYQGILNLSNGRLAVWKSQVREESDTIYATTLGPGSPPQNDYKGFKHLKGMITRLPLPAGGWTDHLIQPIGMKVGTTDVDDDGLYLALPVTTTEGFMGGQVNITQAGDSTVSSKQKLEQICRTIPVVYTPKVRGYRTVLPGETPVQAGYSVLLDGNSVNQASGIRSFTDPSALSSRARERISTLYLNGRTEIFRAGCPPVRSYNLLEPVPHFTYYPFIFEIKGVLYLGVIANGTYGKDVSVGDYLSNAFDCFLLHGRLLQR